MAKLVRLSLSPLSIFMPFRSSYKLGGWSQSSVLHLLTWA